MRLWTLIKLVAGVVVLGVTVFTGLLVWHVQNEPIDGIFTKLVPVQFDPKPMVSLPVANADLPEIDPGAKIFEKAAELIAIDKLPEARERLRTVVNTYPRSKAAPEARRIVGEMNLDDLLSAAHMEDKAIHIVRPGESYTGIAMKHNTSLDCIVYLNGLMDLKGLHPGEELVVMPLDLRVLVEPGRKSLSLWKGGQFIKEYPLLSADVGSHKSAQVTKITSKAGIAGDRRVSPDMRDYRESEKVFSLDKTPLQIRSFHREDKDDDDDDDDRRPAGPGFILSVEDAEELALLLRPGNEVEIRVTGP
ncbi:LysM peptidoglycan-binding domain-containing protein [Luteolibacter flavescens]|uniref:LysM peptidoglycan-binding domain-containing protein n=1 Tax=Luteolibacter flavescens TaxID=1859460 RepID=A0ABT3FW51_9BACT|nr:LysM domain-containing protein [Luteolibacter flavescens]MCW1887808.1 LysM peptidoglycan-binding domain-containing protein [Luteolibacter flavescens]